MHKDERIVELLYKFHTEELNETDREELERWLNQSEDNRRLFEQITSEDQVKAAVERYFRLEKEVSADELYERMDKVKVVALRTRSGWLKILVAASLIGIVVVVAIRQMISRPAREDVKTTVAKVGRPVIKPGSQYAILTLSNGKKIVLDSASDGQLASQGGVRVIKAGGQLSYDGATTGEMVWNKVETPIGSEYQVVLPDLSRVWLNAGSSIRFPVSFAGTERKVEITGEAYFEVTHDADKPFRVAYNNMTVEVLGTHFNINAYSDEDGPKTTLLEGKVKVMNEKSLAVLTPGMQAHLSSDGQLQVTKNVDVEKVVAWKNGLFRFDDDDMHEVMKQAARWYGVKVEYAPHPTDVKITGKIHRNSNFDEFLKVLELLGVQYELKDRTVTIK